MQHPPNYLLVPYITAPAAQLRKRYRGEGLDSTITEKIRTAQVEAEITAIACSESPDGLVLWTTVLIYDWLIKLDIRIHDKLVRLALKKQATGRPRQVLA